MEKIASSYRYAVNSLPARRISKFFKRYATQTSFGFVIAVFLTVTVGEGQAFSVSTPKVSAQLELLNDGFVGKTQLFAGQTVLTGEIQQVILHEVEKGDTLTGIAVRYSTTVGTIIKANNLKISEIEKIQPGTELAIPSVDSDTSLAWLDGLNDIKRQEEINRRQAQRRRSTSLPRIARTIGDVKIIGVFRNLPTYKAYAGQCTQWIQYKRADLRKRMGNGGQYLAYARSYGIPTGKIARVGAAVVTTENAYYGHVAYVIAVSSSSITITEMNYLGPYIVTQRTIPKNSPVIRGYIY